MAGPLDGIVVLDSSAVGPGPRCTGYLRDLGASVVKISPSASSDRLSPPWHAYGAGRGTRRICIDLRSPDGVEVFLRLVERAQVVVESYRPGVADRLGAGAAACRERNPRVVYAAISGYGQDGPYSQWAGHDLNYLGVAGFLATQGRRADGGPALPGATVADSAGGGLTAALAITAALVGGEGATLDVSTTEGVLGLMSLYVDQFAATGEEAAPGTSILTGRYACYDVYPARDGRWLSVAAIEGKFFANLCTALGCEEWIAHQHDDERQDEIRSAFRAAFATRDRDEWVAELAPKDTCVAPVLSIAEVASDDHLNARGAFARIEHPDHGRARQVAPVVAGAERAEGYEAVDPSASHADELLREAGFADPEIETLMREGTVG